jgi:hypothetical protein
MGLLAANASGGEPPLDVIVEPATVDLTGAYAVRQVLVTERGRDGSVRDLTSSCDWSTEPDGVVAILPGGLVVPLRGGVGRIVIRAKGRTLHVPVRVSDFTAAEPISFRNHLMPVLSVGGCNSGTCHGSPNGKNGFHLSLRGFDPGADHVELTHAAQARRVNRLEPEASLLFRKATGAIPHEGGQRFSLQSLPAQRLLTWLAQGTPDDAPNAATLLRLEVRPGPRTLIAPSRRQQLAVLAHFSNGTVDDVTRTTVFTSSSPETADVSSAGLVEFARSGDVAILCRHQDQLTSIRLTCLEPRPDYRWTGLAETNFVDRHVFAKLKAMRIRPAAPCTDEEFIRRVYLDLCGVLPTPAEVTRFLADSSGGKRQAHGMEQRRAALVDALLERPEYADFWALHWADVLRLRSSIQRTKGVRLYHHWLRQQIERNTPFDQVVRALLTASGDTFANPAANFYRIGLDLGRPSAREARAQLTETTAQVFCGVRLQCAKCHNHPLERWTQDDYYGLAAFFARVGRRAAPEQPSDNPLERKVPGAEIVFPARQGELDPGKEKLVPARFLGGPTADLSAHRDRREVLADWLVGPSNRFFARALVNRVWFHLLGRGIVEPVDDFRDSNPPANDELLDALAADFVAHHFDVKRLIRVICTSQTYGLSAHGDELDPGAVRYFARAVTRQHSAEQMLDALCAATEVSEKYPDLPPGTRAAQIADGELQHPFLKVFHKPDRETACECERETEGSLAQALQFVGGRAIKDKLAQPKNRIGRLLSGAATPEQILEELYLATLSRFPSETERRTLLAHVRDAADRRQAWEDVQWALLNSLEFRFRH